MRTNVRVIRNKRVLAGTVLITLIAASCQSSVHNNQSLQSGGLGLSRTEWELLHGRAASQDSGYVYYDDERGRFIINFMASRAAYIKRSYRDSAGVSLDDARSESRKLIPIDSRLLRTYNSSAGTVDLYFTDVLKPMFPKDDYWIRGEPGNFIVLYSSNQSVVDSFVIGLGNNP